MVQISLTIPDILFKHSKKFSEETGYRSVQEFLLEILRERLTEEQRYRKIESQIQGKGLTKKEFLIHMKKL